MKLPPLIHNRTSYVGAAIASLALSVFGCTLCHTISAQGKADAMTYASAPNGLTFEHPEDIGGLCEETGCHE